MHRKLLHKSENVQQQFYEHFYERFGGKSKTIEAVINMK